MHAPDEHKAFLMSQTTKNTQPPTAALPLRKKLTYTVVALGLILGLPLILGEVACRVVMWVKHGVPGHSYGIYMADDEIGAVHRPHSYNSNSVMNNFGLRNTEDIPEQKAAGATRVYCSGGSTTFCYNLNTDEAWPSLLQNKLRATPGHEKDEVLNAGEICFSLGHEFALARRLLPKLKPDVVILFTGVNEGMMGNQFAAQSPTKLDELLASKTWGVPPKNLDQARFWKRNSALTRLWDYYLKRHFEKQATAEFRNQDEIAPRPNDPSMHPYVMANLDQTFPAYIDFIKSQGAVPVVLRFGDNGSVNWYMRDGVRKWRERVVELAIARGVTVCDATSVFERRPDRVECFISSGVHVTALGADITAEELKKTLLALPAPAK